MDSCVTEPLPTYGCDTVHSTPTPTPTPSPLLVRSAKPSVSPLFLKLKRV